MITLPGLIDLHVHFRTPGESHKEDFLTGTQAALVGGFTTVFDMPNNKIPITTQTLLQEKIVIAKKNIVCDVGFYFGSLGENLEELKKIRDQAIGIKLYLNITTGHYLINEERLKVVYKAWSGKQAIHLHCEDETMPFALKVIKETGKRSHFGHVSTKTELQALIKAKQDGLPITCGVNPHYLFLTQEDAKRLGPFGFMKPFLKTKEDMDFLWQNLNWIDNIEADHAPHTEEEKMSNNPPFGVPGLETTLPLLLNAVSEGKLTIEDIIRLCHTNPAKILNIPTDPQTKIEVDVEEEYEIKNEDLKTKCGWSPFAGKKVKGKVKTVYLRGEKVFENGQILAKPGNGKIIYPT